MSGGRDIDVSVIVPTYNRPDALQHCLTALAAQTYPRARFEVLVVDDGGSVCPRSVVEGARSYLPVEMIEAVHGGPAHARNRGVERARGRYLAFTDDDCRPDATWLASLVEALERTPAALVGGRVVNALGANPFASTSQLVVDIVYAHYNRQPEHSRFFASNNLGASASAFRAIGGFDEGFRVVACEDRELCDRWRAAGGGLRYAPQAVVQHAHDLDLRGYARQHFTYGRGAAHFHRIRAARGSGRMREEMAFHLDVRNWMIRPFSHMPVAGMLRTAPLLLLWQAANLLGFLYERVAGTGYRSRPHPHQRVHEPRE